MSTLADRLQAILEEFAPLDRELRMAYLIDWADRFHEVPPAVARRPFPSDHQVPWCQSDVYVWAVPEEGGTVAFHFAVENPQGVSGKALAAILQEVTAGATPAEVGALPEDLAYTLFGQELSMGKGQGLASLVAMVRAFARELQPPAQGARAAGA